MRECSTDLGQLEDGHRCCRNEDLPPHLFSVQDRSCLEENECDEVESFSIELSDGPVASYFKRDNDKTVTDIVQVYDELLKPDTELSRAPDFLNINEIINSMKIVKPVSPFANKREKLLLAKDGRRARQDHFLH